MDGLNTEEKADVAYDSVVFFFNRSQEHLAKFYKYLEAGQEHLAEFHFRLGLAQYHKVCRERERFLSLTDKLKKEREEKQQKGQKNANN